MDTEWVVGWVCSTIVAIALIVAIAIGGTLASGRGADVREARIHACQSAVNVSDCLKLNG